MYEFDAFLNTISDLHQKEKLIAILHWIDQQFPNLSRVVKWNQPMYTDHGTFILGFSVSKNHISVTPEKAGMEHFREKIAQKGFVQSMMLFQIQNNQDIPFDLLKEMIEYNLAEKAEITSFWR